MGILASKYHNPEAARALYELDPELLTFDDLSRQIPFHHEHVQDILGKDAQPSIQDIPPKKTFEELYLIIRDLDGFFAPLHHDMDSRDSL